MVCKGKVRKFGVFICDCGAFYCDECAKAIIGLENACWACYGAIDDSKPVKLPDKPLVIGEEAAHKKGKKL